MFSFYGVNVFMLSTVFYLVKKGHCLKLNSGAVQPTISRSWISRKQGTLEWSYDFNL